MVLLFLGTTLCSGGRTICGCLRVLGMHGEKTFANYHHFLSRNKFSMKDASKILIEMIMPLTESKIILVVDEHLERRRGKKIKAKAIYRDPVASSKSWKVKCQGLKWVVISMVVSFPWSKRPFALPVFCALRLPEDHPKNLKRELRTGTDLACQMLCMIRRWFPDKKIIVLGDGDYARVKLCKICKKLSMTLIARMRADARLHEHPNKSLTKRGRVKKLGGRIIRPEESLWEKVKVAWYGGQMNELLATSKGCIWLGGKTSQHIDLKVVWVKMRSSDEIILMTTDIEMDLIEIISLYVKRWNIEVTFRECRDYLGVETQRQWSDLAIARSTPFLFGLYSLIVLMGNAIYNNQGIKAETTAWYKKEHLTFSDLLRAVRKEISDVNHIINSILNPEFIDKPLEDISSFEEATACGL